MPNSQLQDELLAFLDPKTKLIQVERAEAWARDHPDSELHARLVWDDQIAGQQWRYQQIRQLIILHVRNVDGERQTISLRVDRGKPGGGYRMIDDVLPVPDLVNSMLDDAMRDMLHWIRKYHHLSELTGARAEGVARLFASAQEIVTELERWKDERQKPPSRPTRRRRVEDRPQA